MKKVNVQAIENLSLFCHISGVISVFIGIMVVLMDLAHNEFAHIQVGFFVLITGYAFVKISSKLSGVLRSEGEKGL